MHACMLFFGQSPFPQLAIVSVNLSKACVLLTMRTSITSPPNWFGPKSISIVVDATGSTAVAGAAESERGGAEGELAMLGAKYAGSST